MYPNERIEVLIEQCTGFFNSNWNLLEQALLELGSEPDNQRLQERVRSLATAMQLTVITIDHLQDQREKVDSSKSMSPDLQQETTAAYEMIVAA
jgi:hypothetical protein